MRRAHAEMYGPDTTRVAKYSTSSFHVPYTVGLCEAFLLPFDFGESIRPCFCIVGGQLDNEQEFPLA